MFCQSFNIALFFNSLKLAISFENTFGLLTGIPQTIHKMHEHLMDYLENGLFELSICICSNSLV
jgi:hypothetical protein